MRTSIIQCVLRLQLRESLGHGRNSEAGIP